MLTCNIQNEMHYYIYGLYKYTVVPKCLIQIGAEVSDGHFGTSAEVSGHFGTII